MTRMTEEQRLARKAELTKRIQDLAEADLEGTAIALFDLALTLLTKRYPANLDDTTRTKIKAAYPPATDALMAERATSEGGVAMALAATSSMALIALDYSPQSHASAETKKDSELGVAGKTAAALAAKAFEGALETGISPYGAAATLILSAVLRGRQNGVGGQQLARILMEAVPLTSPPMPLLTEKEVEAKALKALCEQMGISMSEAKKYLKMAKNFNLKEG